MKCGSLKVTFLMPMQEFVAVDLADLVDHQERVAVRQRRHDLDDVGGFERLRLLVHLLPRSRNRLMPSRPHRMSQHDPAAQVYAELQSRGTTRRPGGPVLRPSAPPAGTSLCAALVAASCAPSPMLTWPSTPACPPIATKSPIRAEPGDADLRDDDAVPADLDIVADLDLVIDLRPLADHRVAVGAAVDRRVGADLDVVLDDDAADLRDLGMASRTHGKAETVLADAHTGMDDDAVADQSVLDARMHADRSSRGRSRPPRRRPRRPQLIGAAADLRPRADHGAGLHADAVLEPGVADEPLLRQTLRPALQALRAERAPADRRAAR